MNLTFLGAAAVALLLSCGQTRSCTIVTNGNPSTYLHELAHCNGWDHPAFVAGYDPPPQFIHLHAGKLTVYLTGSDYSGQMATLRLIQYDADIEMEFDETVPRLCIKLWQQHGILAASKDIDKIIGCAIR